VPRKVLPILFVLACLTQAHAEPGTLDTIRDLRLQGQLQVALDQATEQLVKADDEYAVALHLELARIYDRIGLHTDTRPVAAALRHIDEAEALVGPLDRQSQAQVELAYAE
jgi:hypothetical protein